MSKRFFIACLSILLFSFGKISAQGDARPIYLNNPSFEDYPRPSHTPRGWYDCGGTNFILETPPDVHPSGEFGVTQSAQEGDTYLGLVVRENDSFESISQRLRKSLFPGKCYSFSIFIASSKVYKSGIRGTDKEVDFITPIKLRIHGGRGGCDRSILLGESKLITHSEWIEYSFKFEPKQKVTHIVFEAMYKTPTLTPPNGNILLDNASVIQPIPCDEELPLVKKPEVNITSPTAKVAFKNYKLVAKVKNVKEKRKIVLRLNKRPTKNFTYNASTNKLEANLKLKEGTNKISIRVSNSAGNATDDASIIFELPVEEIVKVESESKIELDLKKLKLGETIRVDELFFEINSFKITNNSRPVLDDIYNFLNENSRVSVEIGGHTNRNCDTDYCQTLSTNRAKSVVDFLVQKGIRSNRLTYRGYGKTKPLTFARNAQAQKKNQRVEIKILSVGS